MDRAMGIFQIKQLQIQEHSYTFYAYTKQQWGW